MELKIEDEDLYNLLGVLPEATTAEIKKAYRKKALSCHPDKNPDNPNAAAEFHKLSKVLEILTDAAARKAYDGVLKARQQAAQRHRELDGKRQKLKEQLEAREKSGKQTKSAAEQLKEEIERLRKEGSAQVQEEMDFVINEIRLEKSKKKVQEEPWDSSKHRVKLKWTAEKSDSQNGGYNEEILHKFLSKYGDITVLVVSSKKKGSALVEFKTKRGAEMAVEIEKGLASNPLTLTWVDGPPPSAKYRSTTIKDSDFESVILTKMRQAEERKRLIEQMQAEDEENS